MKRTLDWDKYLETSARAVSGGIVMLKNDGALPLKQGGTAAVFGRIQLHYYKSALPYLYIRDVQDNLRRYRHNKS